MIGVRRGGFRVSFLVSERRWEGLKVVEGWEVLENFEFLELLELLWGLKEKLDFLGRFWMWDVWDILASLWSKSWILFYVWCHEQCDVWSLFQNLFKQTFEFVVCLHFVLLGIVMSESDLSTIWKSHFAYLLLTVLRSGI